MLIHKPVNKTTIEAHYLLKLWQNADSSYCGFQSAIKELINASLSGSGINFILYLRNSPASSHNLGKCGNV